MCSCRILKNSMRTHLTHPVVPLFPRDGRLNAAKTSPSLGKRRGRVGRGDELGECNTVFQQPSGLPRALGSTEWVETRLELFRMISHELKLVAISSFQVALFFVVSSVVWLAGCGPSVTKEEANLKARTEWIENTLKRLTLEEKIGQMI